MSYGASGAYRRSTSARQHAATALTPLLLMGSAQEDLKGDAAHFVACRILLSISGFVIGSREEDSVISCSRTCSLACRDYRWTDVINFAAHLLP
jgi:hypothetical protein